MSLDSLQIVFVGLFDLVLLVVFLLICIYTESSPIVPPNGLIEGAVKLKAFTNINLQLL